MRLHNMLTSLSEVPLVLLLLKGAPWFVLALAALYVLRPVIIRLIECRSRETIARIRYTPANGIRAIAAPERRKHGSRKRKKANVMEHN